MALFTVSRNAPLVYSMTSGLFITNIALVSNMRVKRGLVRAALEVEKNLISMKL